MPKLKTHKTASKRFKITGNGKLVHRHAFNNHMFLNKGGSQKRGLDDDQVLDKSTVKRIKRMLGI
ncbi:MAG: 50S ribosomal protein L35 [bacterium]